VCVRGWGKAKSPATEGDIKFNNELAFRLELGSGLDLVLKQCSLCEERHWCYAHGWPGRQCITVSSSFTRV